MYVRRPDGSEGPDSLIHGGRQKIVNAKLTKIGCIGGNREFATMIRFLALASLLCVCGPALAAERGVDPTITGSVTKTETRTVSRDGDRSRNNAIYKRAFEKKKRLAACREKGPLADIDRTIKADLRQKIGQILVAGFKGRSIDDPGFREMLGLAERGRLGGLLFLRRNVGHRDDLRQMISRFRKLAKFAAPIISVDQEGGIISRLGRRVRVRPVPSAATVARTLSPAQAEAVYRRMASDLAFFGFNFNFGPVVDVNLNPQNPIIGKLGRSFSSDPKKVDAYARAFIRAHRDAGIWTSLKHFPGHGSSRGDSHKGPVDVSGIWNGRIELRPYRDLVRSCDADSVMVGHIQIAPGTKPASINSSIIEKILRTDIGFQGLVITDDIRMDALMAEGLFSRRAALALKAGNDLLILSSKKDDKPLLITRFIEALAKAAEKDEDLRRRIDEAFFRVVAFRKSLSSRDGGSEKRVGRASGPATERAEADDGELAPAATGVATDRTREKIATGDKPESWQVALRILAKEHKRQLARTRPAKTD